MISTFSPDCDNCGGGGYIRYEVPLGDSRYGRIYPCRKCNGDNLYISAGISPDEGNLRVGGLKISGRPGTAAMVAAAQAFRAGGLVGMLSICGGYGVGKSHILKSLAAYAINLGEDCQYATMAELIMHIREAYSSQVAGDSDLGRLKKYINCRLLLVDEIDKSSFSEFARSIQALLFDNRYRAKKTLGTVLAWNGGLDIISGPMPWLASRLSEFSVVENNDPDYRGIIHAQGETAPQKQKSE